MAKIKTLSFNLVNDRILLFSFVGFVLQSFISFLNYFDTPAIEWNIRIAIYLMGLDLIFFLGRKGVWLAWCLTANIMFYFSTFKNVSYFAVIAFLIAIYPKSKIYLLAIYAINVFVICHLHNLEIMKIVFHLCSCAFIYLIMGEVVRKSKSCIVKKLNLTDDEKIILEYLKKGYKQNDIIEFSAETVSRKLKRAKVRNEIETTKELLEQFIKENS